MVSDSPSPDKKTDTPEVEEEEERTLKDENIRELQQRIIREVIQPYQSTHKPKPTKNVLNDRFTIAVNSPLPHLDTKLAKAYEAVDATNKDRKCYALVSDLSLPPRLRGIRSCKDYNIPNGVTLLDAGVANLTNPARQMFTLVYTQPEGVKLTEALKTLTKRPSDGFLIENIILPIIDALHAYHELELPHGGVNPNNLYYSTTLTLGECLIEPCGYSQPYRYEPPERAQSMPSGKGEGTLAQDYYALGVLIAQIFFGNDIFYYSKNAVSHTLHMLKEGSYSGLLGREDIPDRMLDFFRGTLNDSRHERWSHQQVRNWCRGRKFNVLVPNIPAVGARSYAFKNNEHKNFRSLSHALGENWEEAYAIVTSSRLPRWIDLSARRKEMADVILRTHRQLQEDIEEDPKFRDELIARSLIVLDPVAPIRWDLASAHVDGLGVLYIFALQNNQPELAKCILLIIEQGMIGWWADWHSKLRNEELPSHISNAMWVADRIRFTMHNTSLGFGKERVLYDLNPDLPCKSPLLQSNLPTTIRALLIEIDTLAAEYAGKEEPMDMHIAGFIGSKVGIQGTVVLTELEHIPELATHKGIIALKIYAMAQEKTANLRVPGLTAWLALNILEAIDLYHSKSLRRILQGGLLQIAGSGSITAMLEFLSSEDHSTADDKGYTGAAKKYYQMEKEIAELRYEPITQHKAKLKGYKIAKNIAYSCLVTTLLIVFSHAIFM